MSSVQQKIFLITIIYLAHRYMRQFVISWKLFLVADSLDAVFKPFDAFTVGGIFFNRKPLDIRAHLNV